MSNEHYRQTYYSETEARAIVKRNDDRITAKGRRIRKAKQGIDDRLEAKELGLTMPEYFKMLGEEYVD